MLNDFLYKMLPPMADRLGRLTMVLTISSHGMYQPMVTRTLGLAGDDEVSPGGQSGAEAASDAGLPRDPKP